MPVAILSILGCHEPSTLNPDEAFAVHGRPVAAACVYELSGDGVAAVDVEGCAKSRRHADGRSSRSADGWRYENPALLGDGFFCYWWLGRTDKGTHALLTAVNGGSSGIDFQVLFVTLKAQDYAADGKTGRRWTLTSLGRVALGDRTRDRAELEEGQLVVRTPSGDCRRIPVPQF
ncbi:MAG TPA: hypothetical protein VE981_00545 [Planctomycetota bacterium]|nr:hypothetical protein [Planctomycetota bacterium]